MTDEARRRRGLRIRREVLGDVHVNRAQAMTTPFTEPFQDFLTRVAWGDVWDRPGLDRRMRSAVTLAALVALRAEGEIGMHVRAALRNGLTPDEIGEVLLHATVYAGLPAGNAAFAIAQRALADASPPDDRLPPDDLPRPACPRVAGAGPDNRDDNQRRARPVDPAETEEDWR